MNIHYPVRVNPQEPSGYFVQFIDLDEAFTEGETMEEALFNAAEVLSAILSWRMDNSEAIPEPTEGLPDTQYISPDAKTQAALLVRKTRGDRPLAEIARALETSWPTAQRLENPHHSPTLKQLEKAAAALGKRLILAFE